MRKAGISLQILGGLICAGAGMAASFYFERYIMMSGNGPAKSINDVVAMGLEVATVALLVTGFGAFLIIYGGRVARRSKTASESPKS